MQQSKKRFHNRIISFDLFAIFGSIRKKSFLVFPWESWILTGHVPVHGQVTPRFLTLLALSPYISLNEAVLLQCKAREVNSTM